MGAAAPAERERGLIRPDGPPSGATQHLKLHAPDAGRYEADVFCRFPGKIDHPPICVGTAIVDAHHDRLVRRFVRDPDTRSERQASVGGGQIVHVEGLTVRRLTPMEGGSVP